jgi:hypothetical protein
VIFQDLLPVLGVLVALMMVSLRARDQPSESHRFATAMFVIAPVLATVALKQLARVSPGGAAGGAAALVVYVSVGLGIASTLQWLQTAWRRTSAPRRASTAGNPSASSTSTAGARPVLGWGR